jgi:hypothetical protein
MYKAGQHWRSYWAATCNTHPERIIWRAILGEQFLSFVYFSLLSQKAKYSELSRLQGAIRQLATTNSSEKGVDTALQYPSASITNTNVLRIEEGLWRSSTSCSFPISLFVNSGNAETTVELKATKTGKRRMRFVLYPTTVALVKHEGKSSFFQHYQNRLYLAPIMTIQR